MTQEAPRSSGVRFTTLPAVSEELDLVVGNGRVVSSHDVRREDIGIRDGRIVAMGDLGDAETRRRIDATGLVVMPGVIDAHVHPTYLDDPYQTSVAAVCGGVTSAMHFAYAFAGESLLAAAEELRDAATRASLVDFGIHATMFDAHVQVREIEAVASVGVRTFKVFLAYASQGWMTDDAALVEVMKAVSRVGGLLLVHCENGIAIDALEQSAREGSLGDGPSVIGATRPPTVEAEAVHRVIALASTFDCNVFIVHVTSAAALEVVRTARRNGCKVAAETCPQYLTLTEQAVVEWGGLAKIGPPLRTDADREALWEGLEDRSLQTIGSDHVPKKTPADRTIPLLDSYFGAPSIETMLSVVYDEGVARGRIPITRLVEVMCENPARIFGLWPMKGALQPGSDADLVLWDEVSSGTISSQNLHSRAGYTLFEGRSVTGRHVATLRRGVTVAKDGDLTGDESPPEFLSPKGVDLREHDAPRMR